QEVTVVLTPTMRVSGQLECKEMNSKPEWANTMVTPDGFASAFAQSMSTQAMFDFVLPAGKYKFESYGTDVEQVTKTVTLESNRNEYDLGTSDLKASQIAKLKGKTPPKWIIAD